MASSICVKPIEEMIKDGREAGREVGRQEGQNRINQLIILLSKENRGRGYYQSG